MPTQDYETTNNKQRLLAVSINEPHLLDDVLAQRWILLVDGLVLMVDMVDNHQ